MITYFRPVRCSNNGTNAETGITPEELGNNIVFMTRVMCERWLDSNGYNREDFTIVEHHDVNIKDVKFIDEQSNEVPKEFVDWRFSDRPCWFVNVRTPGTTSDYVWNSFEEAKKWAKKDFDKGCVSLEFYKIELTIDQKNGIDDWGHLARKIVMDSIGKQTPMILAICEPLDRDEFDDDTATYGEKLQLMSFERIVEAIKNLKETSYVMMEEEFHKKWNDKDRDEMDEAELSLYLDDCYAMFAYYGFLDRLDSPYSDEEPEQGQKFEVIRPITLRDCDDEPGNWDPEVLPVWEIRLEKGNGSEDDDRIRYCYPEEITVLGKRSIVVPSGPASNVPEKATSSYDVVFEPMVNVTIKVADPTNPTEEEIDEIIRLAAEKIKDQFSEKINGENVKTIRLYEKDVNDGPLDECVTIC